MTTTERRIAMRAEPWYPMWIYRSYREAGIGRARARAMTVAHLADLGNYPFSVGRGVRLCPIGVTEGPYTWDVTVQEAESEAARLLETSWFAIGKDLPVDPARLARGLGIDVRTVPMRADESGSITIMPDEQPVIRLNAADHENRQRFTCAHEIGHYVRRAAGPSEQTFVDYRDTLAGLGVNEEEIFANQFAAALLMPAVHVAMAHRGGMSVSRMAAQFGTSVQAMELRLRNLRLA